MGDAGFDAVRAAVERSTAKARLPLSSITPQLPVRQPGKVVCLGLNYAAHIAEGPSSRPDYPVVFLRALTSLIPAEAPLVRPLISDQLDYEGELAVVIGRAGRHVPKERALSIVAGYSVFNDGSIRDYQRRTPQWTVGKNFDATGAFGPEFVTADELPPGASGLRLQTRLNGEVVQNADTADMIFSVAETIALLSQVMTFLPGDVLVMGTPSGVGVARVVWRLLNEPPAYPETMKPWERNTAHIVHFLLYAAMVLMPLSGWAIVSAHPPSGSPGAAAMHAMQAAPAGASPGARPAGAAIGPPPGAPPSMKIWNVFPLPTIAPIEAIGEQPGGVRPQHKLHEEFVSWHTVGGFLLLGLLLLHVAGALKHQFIDKEAEFARMGIGRGRR